jgi:uncharacterized membrane protein YphA (DoxX/SURF4 family)
MSVPTKTRRFVIAGARYVLAGIFLLSAIGKLHSPHGFASFLASLPLISLIGSGVLLAAVVTIEFLLAVLLLFPRTAKVGGLASFGVLCFLQDRYYMPHSTKL